MEGTLTRRMLPEVTLIGILLLITGIAEAISGPIKLWQLMEVWSKPAGVFAISDIVLGTNTIPHGVVIAVAIANFVFAAAAIICGIGLLRRACWAWRMSIVSLVGLIVLTIATQAVETSSPIITLLHYDAVQEAGKREALIILKALLIPLNYLVMLLFLATTRVRAAFGFVSTGTPLQRIAEAFVGFFTRRLHPVTALVGLLLISIALPGILLLSGMWQSYQSPQAGLLPPSILLLGMINTIGALLAGVLLISQLKWAELLAVPILVLGAILPGIFYFSMISNQLVQLRVPILAFYLFIAVSLLSPLLTGLMQAWYLVRYRNEEPVPPSLPTTA